MKSTAVASGSSIVRSQLHVPPILRIPLEITSQIFQHCLPEDEFPRPAVKCAPTQLTQVCCVWRELAIGTPRLWSNVLLSCTHDFEGTNESVTVNLAPHSTALEVWMTRATPLLMSIQIRYPNLTELAQAEVAWGTVALPPVFRVIVDNAERWKDVRLAMPPNYLVVACIRIQHNTSNLENLHVADTDFPMFGPEKYKGSVILCPDSAKTLLTLSARASLFYSPPARRNPLFVRLHTLTLTHSLPKNCLHLLKYCPALEDLNLHFYDMDDGAIPSDHPTLVLPRLRNFRLSHTGNSENGDCYIPADQGGEIGRLLDSLQLPRLQTFHLWMTIMGSARYNDPNLPWDYMSRLITRSNCSLNALELRSSHIDTPSILEILRLSPDLKHIAISANEELECNIAHLLPALESVSIFDEWD